MVGLIDLKYGPQTIEIEGLIERIKTMTPKEAQALADVYDAARSGKSRDAADAVESAGRNSVRRTAWYAAREAERHGARTGERNAAWYSTWHVVRDAISALAVRDLITPAQFDALYEPWASAMEERMPTTQTDFKYGPQTIAIEGLVDRVKTITPEQAKALLDAYDDAMKSEETWNAWRSALSAENYSGRGSMREAALNAAFTDKWYAARYTVLAMLVSDLISPDRFDLLYKPWASVMETK
jgi:hypothetical protein